MIYPYQGKYPDIHPTVFMTDDVTIIGDVHIAEDANIWFGTVIRGDVNRVTIGARSNIQDNCTLHETWKKYPLIIGDDVTVGHGAILHACTVEDACLIGMGAKVLDNARIGSESLVAAGAVVREGFDVPPGSLVAGVPAKIQRELSEEERARLRNSAVNYLHYVREYRVHRDLERGMDFHSYLEYRRTGRI
ncbi:MAG: gamma carbonic anhydrase family protein [Bacteroidetes bacterium]|nr:gamma carbonic anhydrase family protein [Bacteroidota bacterium]